MVSEMNKDEEQAKMHGELEQLAIAAIGTGWSGGLADHLQAIQVERQARAAERTAAAQERIAAAQERIATAMERAPRYVYVPQNPGPAPKLPSRPGPWKAK